jgi:hypothetical protein
LTGEPTGANAAERSAPSLNLKLSKLQPSKHWFMVNCRTNAVSGSYVTLFSPEAPPQWGGNFRIASLLNLQLEPDLLNDELFPEVAWDWFSAPLIAAGVKRLSGTFTIVKDQSFSSSSTWDSAPDALAHSDPPDVPDPSIISHDLNFSPHFAAEIQNQAQIRASWSWDETPDANLTTLADNSWSAWLKSVAKFNA